MDVCNQRSVVAPFEEPIFNLLTGLGLFDPLNGDPHNFTAGIGKPHCLIECGLHIAGAGGGHRLDPDRVFPSDPHISNQHLSGFESLRLVDRFAVFHRGAVYYIS